VSPIFRILYISLTFNFQMVNLLAVEGRLDGA
jgi:hypothetical protein